MNRSSQPRSGESMVGSNAFAGVVRGKTFSKTLPLFRTKRWCFFDWVQINGCPYPTGYTHCYYRSSQPAAGRPSGLHALRQSLWTDKGWSPAR